MTNGLNDLWESLKPGIIPIEVSEGTERVLHQVFFAGAAAALSLQGAIEAEAQRLVHFSLTSLEEEVARELQLPEEQ